MKQQNQEGPQTLQTKKKRERERETQTTRTATILVNQVTLPGPVARYYLPEIFSLIVIRQKMKDHSSYYLSHRKDYENLLKMTKMLDKINQRSPNFRSMVDMKYDVPKHGH